MRSVFYFLERFPIFNRNQGEREDLKKLRGLGGLDYRGVVKL